MTTDDGLTYDDHAVVSARLQPTVSSLVGRTDDDRTATFKLRHRDGRWRIDNPFAKVTFANIPLWYLEVNKLRVARTSYPVATGSPRATDPTYLMFPGLYLPYSGSSQVATVHSLPLAAVPGPDIHYVPTVNLAGSLNAAAQRESDAFVDACLADVVAAGTRCGLAMPIGYYRNEAGYVEPAGIESASWQIIRHPKINFVGATAPLDNGLVGFASQITVPGELRLTATGTTLNGKRITFVQACLTRRTSGQNWGTTVGVNADHTTQVRWVNPQPLDNRKPTTAQWLQVDCHGDR